VKKPICIIALTQKGKSLAERLRNKLDDLDKDVQILYKPQPFTETIHDKFNNGHPMVFITATGIAVRSLAGVLKNKHQDPPVLVMDERGQFVIPLLSGHEGGANEMAKNVARMIEAQVVITTAKTYLSPVYTVGMGCEKGCSVDHLIQLLVECINLAGLTFDDIQSINSIDIKGQEQGLIELAELKNIPYKTYSAKQLSVVEGQLSTKSDYIYSVVGVYGVAESAALLAAQMLIGETAELLVNKQKTDKATCAIARSYPLNNEN